MFTGIIETVGTILRIEESDKSTRPSLNSDVFGRDYSGVRSFKISRGSAMLSIGRLHDKINVNGVGLRVTNWDEDSFEVSVDQKTLWGTNMHQLGVGSEVNLERPVQGISRFEGHFVRGSIDTVAAVVETCPRGNSIFVRLALKDQGLHRYIAVGGFIAINGVSATVENNGRFRIELDHETQAFKSTSAGDVVNVEVDLTAKLVEKQVEAEVKKHIDSAVENRLIEQVDDVLEDMLKKRLDNEFEYHLSMRCDDLIPSLLGDLRSKVNKQLDL